MTEKTSAVAKTCSEAQRKGREAERGGREILPADQTGTEEENGLCSRPFRIVAFRP